MANRPKGIAILIPSNGRHPHLLWSIAFTQMVMAHPVGQQVFIFSNFPDPEKVKRGEFTRAQQREELVESALKVNPEFLMWIDDDTVPPAGTLLELFFVLSQHPKAAIAGGIYMTKTLPPMPIVFKDFGAGPFWQWTIGDVFDCVGLGTGCMMVRADVMRHIPRPWFKDTAEVNPGETETINGQEIRITSHSGTDDIYFCKKVIEAGYEIWAHGGLLAAHIDYDDEDKIYNLPTNSYPYVSYEERRKAQEPEK